MWAIELAAGVSISRVDEADRNTISGAVLAENTTEGVLTTEGAGSGQQHPPTC